MNSKFQRPRLRGVLARPRLLDVLSAGDAITWIAAAPGAGKTTLAAAFVEGQIRDLGCTALWYRVDAGDNDPAAFFQGLRTAAAQGGELDTRGLPAFAVDAGVDVGGYARRFFRALYADLRHPLLLVLDNFQDAADASFQQIVAEAFEQLPDPHRAIVLSLSDPPPSMARLVANGRIAVWDPRQLLLTREESGHIVRSRLQADEATLTALHERSAGWAAGLVLMIEDLRRHGAAAARLLPDSHEPVFDYFAGVIFAASTAAEQHVLMTTAGLPRLTADLARAASGSPAAARLIDRFHRRHLFVDTWVDRHGGSPAYRYHALFDAFLCARARRDLPASTRREAAARAAEVLQSQGHREDAVAVLLAAGLFDAAARAIVHLAPVLGGQGRWRTLRGWITALPAATVAAEPGLQYAYGACGVWSDPVTARQSLEGAFHAYATRGDRGGQILAAGAITRACILGADWSQLDPWIDVLARLLGATGDGDEVPAATRCTGWSRLLYVTLARQPCHPALPAWADRTLEGLELQPEPGERLMAAYSLLFYFTWTGQSVRGEALQRQIAPLAGAEGVSPVSRAHWLWAQANFVLRVGIPADALALIDSALQIALTHDLTIAGVIRRHRVAHLLSLQRLGEAQAELARLSDAPLIEPYLELRAWLAWQQGQTALAFAEARAALDLARQRGRTFYVALDWLLLASIGATAGQHDAAGEALRQYRLQTQGIAGDLAPFQAALVQAALALQLGDRTRCHQQLHLALDIGQRQRYGCGWGWSPALVTPLLVEALRHDICADYARSLIRLHHLTPPSAAPEGWPWAVKVVTLGRFEVQRDGIALPFAGKAQRKPLELLKVLAAHGPGGVALDRVIDWLWPNPGEGGRKTLDVTVHRLRRLLGLEAAVEVGDGRARLDPRHVWIDAWALDSLLESLLPLAGEAATVQDLFAAAPTVLGLYRGAFLASQAETPWQMAPRNRASSQFLRYMQQLGHALEADRQWARAAALYQRVIELDPLAEAFYRQQMLCLRAQGLHAEALEVFRRCRHTLSTTLGIAPSLATQNVYRALIEP